MMKSVKICAYAVTLASSSVAAHADQIDDLVGQEMSRSNVPGIAIAVVGSDGPARVKGYGLANLEHSVPVHSDTLFKAGALGMQFTAAAIMLLVEDGKISLDESVRKYLPDSPRKWQPVTIRQLLNHTSGLPATPNGDFRTEYTDAELLAIIGAEELNFPAGTRWRFSYAGYIVLGFVMKQVTGEHYAQFLSHRLFAPLGMTSARRIDELAVVRNRASGYELRDGALRNAEWVSATANSTADGSVYVSALDYAAWSTALARGRLLSPASWAAIGAPARLKSGASCAYGFGWNLREAKGAQMWNHAGSWQGFQTYAAYVPTEKVTVAVFANGERANVRDLAQRILAARYPALALPEARPMDQANTAAVARFEKVLSNLMANTIVSSEFAGYAKLDLTELTAQYAQTLAPLGAVQQFAQFAAAEMCGGTEYIFRARFERGVVDMRVHLGPDDRIDDLEINPVAGWASPL